MTKDEVVHKLKSCGFVIKKEARLPNNIGYRIETDGGAIVNIYDSGKITVQGKNTTKVQECLEDATGNSSSCRRVFVVYGHDKQARTELEALLRRWKIDPLILDQLPSEGQTIIEKLETIKTQANFAVVLATPDDEGYRKGHPNEKAFRARQNVVLELGMMLAHLGRRRVVILMKNVSDMERPSDIQGLIYIPFNDHVDEARVQLAKELEACGLSVDVKDL